MGKVRLSRAEKRLSGRQTSVPREIVSQIPSSLLSSREINNLPELGGEEVPR